MSKKKPSLKQRTQKLSSSSNIGRLCYVMGWAGTLIILLSCLYGYIILERKIYILGFFILIIPAICLLYLLYKDKCEDTNDNIQDYVKLSGLVIFVIESILTFFIVYELSSH